MSRIHMHLTPTARPSSPLSSRGSRQTPRGCLLLFGLVFLLTGLTVSYFLGVRPLLSVAAAQHWIGAPAVVTSSEVRSHRGSDSTTYSIHIAYRYTWGNASFTSDRYSFATGSSSGRASKQNIVDQYPAGREFTVWVNPGNPSESVIHRGLRPIYFLLLAFGGVFALVGLAIVVGGLRLTARKTVPVLRDERGTAAFCVPPPGKLAPDGTLELKPGAGPWLKVGGMLFLCLFWNGIVGVFLHNLWEENRRGSLPIGEALFLLPFLLIGLAILAAFLHTLLAAFNPRVLLLLGPGHPRSGASLTLDWQFLGSTQRLRDFSILLVGTESATYRRGTTTHTDSRAFHRQTLLHADGSHSFENGSVPLHLPPELPPSFEAPHNKIQWKILVHGTIDWWPDLSQEYPIVLLPLGAE